MAIKMTTPMSEINALIEAETKRVDALTIKALSNLGDDCVTEARDRPQAYSWFDQTGNLRSSIGYVVVAHGNIIKRSGFETVMNGSEGSMEGKKLAEELAKKYSSGYALIVVAGMNYAEYVEAKDNKSVLASAEISAHAEINNMMEKLKSQVAK
nr:MAG TPA: hypothetical protein [Caudoviricetes sp.]